MNRRFICSVLLVVVSVTTISQGNRIVFTATPTTISPGVTPEFNVRCGLEDEGNTGVSRVNSIIIKTVDGSVQKEVARIANRQAATGGFSTTGASVTGDLSDKAGYLQVTWPSPEHGLAGQYTCDIVAVAESGDNIKFKSSIQVVSTGKNADSSDSKQCQCTTDIEALKKAVRDSQGKFDSLEKTVNDLKTSSGGLSSVHNEEGVVLCRNSDSWGQNGDKWQRRNQVKEVRFSTPYARNPLVAISPVTLDMDQSKNIRYTIAIRDVTPTGFKVVCETWLDTYIYLLDVRWVSIAA